MPASPQAYLRAINAPPIMGPYSAMTTTNYTGAGIGVGPGGQMIRKSPQEIDAAAAAWDAILGGGNRFAGLIFGDTPGAAQSNVLSLRAAREAEALGRAQLAFQQSNAAAQLRALQQNNALAQQLKKYEIDQQTGLGQARLAYQDADSMRDFLSRLTGTAAKGGTASDPAAIQAILDGTSEARTAGIKAGQQARSVAQAMYDAAREAATPFGKVVSVTPSTRADNPLPVIRIDSQALDSLDKETRSTNFSGGLDNPAALMQHLTDAALAGTGAMSVPAGPLNIALPVAENRMDQYHQALAQQEEAKARIANLAQMLSVQKGRGGSGGSGGGLSPAMLQAILQMTARVPGAGVGGQMPAPPPAPTYVGGRAFGSVPPPLTVLDQLNAQVRVPEMGPYRLLPATRNDAAAQAAWYAAHPNVDLSSFLTTDAPPAVAPYLPGNSDYSGLADRPFTPPPTFAVSQTPLANGGKYVVSGGRIVDANSREAIFEAFRNERAAAEPDLREHGRNVRDAVFFEPLDTAIAKKLDIQPEQIGGSKFYRSPVEIVARDRDAFIAKMEEKFGPKETNLFLLKNLTVLQKSKKK